MGNQLKLAALKAVTFGGWLLEGFNEKTLPVLKKYYLVNCSEGEGTGGSIQAERMKKMNRPPHRIL